MLAGSIAGSLLAFGCIGSKAPAAEGCPTYAGTYVGNFANSGCGAPTDTRVVVEQVGCDVQTQLAGVGTVHGDVDSYGSWNFEIFPSLPCLGGAGGTARISGNRISGSYTGTMTGGGCCPSFTIGFELIRQSKHRQNRNVRPAL